MNKVNNIDDLARFEIGKLSMLEADKLNDF